MLPTLLSFTLFVLGLMLVHKWCPLVGAILCSSFTYFISRKFLHQRLELLYVRNRPTSSLRSVIFDATFLVEWAGTILSFFRGAETNRRKKSTDGQENCLCVRSEVDIKHGIDISELNPECISEIRVLVDNISTHHIRSWYEVISSDRNFPRDIRFIIEDVLLEACSRLSKLERCKLVNRVLLAFNQHFGNYLRSANSVKDEFSKKSLFESFKMTDEIVNRYDWEHEALQDDTSEWCYQQRVTATIVQLIEPPNVLSSRATKELVIEILAKTVLAPVIDIISSPAWLNYAVLRLFASEHVKNLDGLCTCKQECYIPEQRVASPPTDVSSSRENVPGTVIPEITVSTMASSSNAVAEQYCIQNGKTKLKVNIVSFDDSEQGKTFKKLIKRARSLDSISPSTQDNLELVSYQTFIKTPATPHVCINRTFLGDNLSLPGEAEIEQAEEAEEFLESQMFLNLRITKTESRTEPGKGVYTVYCIEYDALTSSDETQESCELIRKTVSVKRRFNEFLNLQGSMENNSELRKHLKGVKGPSKWLANPLTSDKKNVQERKIFLQNYLQELCSRDAIARSVELQRFLDFGKMGETVYYGKSSNSSGTRLDKVFAQGMKGAFDLLKTALPGGPQGDMGSDSHLLSPLDDNGSPKSLQFPVLGNLFNETPVTDINFVYTEERLLSIQQAMFNYMDNFDQSSSPEFSPPQSPSYLPVKDDMSDLKVSQVLQTLTSTLHTDAPKEEIGGQVDDVINCLHQDIPLTSALIDLGVSSVIEPHFCTSTPFVLLFQIFVGKFLERLLSEKIHKLGNPEYCAQYLHLLHKALWPDEKSTDPLCTCARGEIAACLAFQSFLPTWLSALLGPQNVSESVNLLISSVQIKKLNKCLVYHLLDGVLELLVDDSHKTQIN